jgi:hypothetical protein
LTVDVEAKRIDLGAGPPTQEYTSVGTDTGKRAELNGKHVVVREVVEVDEDRVWAGIRGAREGDDDPRRHGDER